MVTFSNVIVSTVTVRTFTALTDSTGIVSAVTASIVIVTTVTVTVAILHNVIKY